AYAGSLAHVHLSREGPVRSAFRNLHADGNVLSLRANGDEKEESSAKRRQELAAVGRQAVEQIEYLVALGFEFGFEPALVGGAKVVSHGRPPVSSPRLPHAPLR